MSVRCPWCSRQTARHASRQIKQKLGRSWDVATGKEKLTFQAAFQVAIIADGKTFASRTGDGVVKLWDVATGKEKATMRGHWRLRCTWP
jgi:WD40 repeat protein